MPKTGLTRTRLIRAGLTTAAAPAAAAAAEAVARSLHPDGLLPCSTALRCALSECLQFSVDLCPNAPDATAARAAGWGGGEVDPEMEEQEAQFEERLARISTPRIYYVPRKKARVGELVDINFKPIEEAFEHARVLFVQHKCKVFGGSCVPTSLFSAFAHELHGDACAR